MSEEALARRMGLPELSRIAFDEATIGRRVQELGSEITAHYEGVGPGGRGLLVLGLLKGSFIFVADLVRRIHLPLQVDFLVASSYGSSRVSSGEVRLLYDPQVAVEGRDVLLVEDIVDSGTTLDRLVPLLEAKGPRSLEVCALLHKRLTPRTREPRWVGFDAPREFLVGYGLDHAEAFRHLPFIGSL